ncbi:MAG TPA: sugar phosphate isomerase/epimerase [Chryseolinea sp.]|nr:sugar phosphate isomerase/epimerase [Chryseolinea sp.]
MRPHFLRTVFVLLTVACGAPAIAQEIGLELYSLRHQLETDPATAMAKVKQMGFRDVELSGTYGMQFPQLIKLLAENRLNVVSYGADFERLRDFPQRVADEARSYGARFVVCFWIPHRADTFKLADAEEAAFVLNNAGKVMARNGLMLAYHPHGYEFDQHGDGTIFDHLVQQLDTRVVQLQMDVFWIKQAGQDPVALLKKYHNRWISIHLKDRQPGTPNSNDGKADDETNVVLGKGDVGIADLMKEAKRLGIQHFFIEDESSRSEEQIPKSLEFLKSLEQ